MKKGRAYGTAMPARPQLSLRKDTDDQRISQQSEPAPPGADRERVDPARGMEPQPVSARRPFRCGHCQGPVMAHTHAAYLEVRFDDGRDPEVFVDVTYTPWRDGVTVYKDGVAHRFDLAYVMTGLPELVC